MEYLVDRVEVEVNSKAPMVNVGVREKQGAGCLLSNELIAPGLVLGPDAYMALPTSAVLLT